MSDNVVRESELNFDKADDIKRQLVFSIENTLNQLFIMHRIFGRTKSQNSLNKKLGNEDKKYIPNIKMIEDIIGIRITLYFSDDIDIVHDILKTKFKCKEESTRKDNFGSNTFEASCHNHVFEIPCEIIGSDKILDNQNICDSTFEVQLRTILSEGWHEVEHDFRYKNKSHWKEQPIFDRQLNGLLATLETADWGMLQLFNELAFSNYKAKAWNEMVKHKFRIRFDSTNLCSEVFEFMDINNEFSKKVYRFSRKKLLTFIYETKLNLPLNLNNIIFIINELDDELNNEEIRLIAEKDFKFTYYKIQEAIKTVNTSSPC
ncbi:RelA/SpoT domain-containing protein [Acinetobacter vivianii]|uniref:RelA/SpoT domain-containing protein n=1 Tax=Acinetobacter vivianii TaxID=1776742 RepID=UPI002DB82D77|nr:RelA/SpoT domain-containing protein [Acinetobacter vivianii]MEB6478265.1 RelA/SpoT domain-containing protein [Acinetobacter vivianii]MEB6657904.1 RelA/SpoT domain-containing protein [Acinetobacter vivianii]